MKSQFWDTPTMNKSEEAERLKLDKKLLKPQIERRRRERMNRSLENLRILLLQGPEQQAASRRRVEKAEILEHTVLFLQNCIIEAKKSRPGDQPSSEGLQFLDGFSACLQKATRFLQEESEARGLRDSMSSSLYRCLSHPHRPRVRSLRHSHVMQGLLCLRRHTHSHPYRIPPRYTHHHTIQRHHNQNMASMSRPAMSPQAAGRQCVWRPWP